MRRKPLVQSLVAALVFGGCALSAHATDWLQFGYDQAHSGYNAAEKGYPIASANTAQWSVNVHAFGSTTALSVGSTPVYLSGVTTASGIKDLIFIVTANGTLVAFAANDGSVIWSKQPSNQQTNEGTTGAAAIDPNLQFVYAYGLDGNVHKYQVGDGTEVLTGGTTTGKTNGWPEISTVKPDVEKGAAGIAFSTPPGGVNYLYHVTNGYGGDGGDYQGHVTTIDLSTGSQHVFNAMCSNLLDMHFVESGTPKVDDCNILGGPSPGRAGQMGGIWGRPGAIYDAQTNRIFVATGNGLFDANMSGDYEWGDSVLSLNPDGTGSGLGMPVDSYTPSDYANLYGGDTDLGSTAPAILPSTSATFPHLAIQSGKDSCVRLINLDDMSGQGGPAHSGGELNAATSCSTDGMGGDVVFPQPAVWVNPADNSTWVYVTNGDKINAYTLDVSGTPSLSKMWTGPGGTSAAIANGTVYYVSSSTIFGLDALTGTQVWSAAIGGNKWQTPIVVNGHLYVADNGKKLWSFALDGIFKNGFE